MEEIFTGKLGVIVYHANHLKSEQTLFSLYEKGYRNVTVYALPFVERPERQVLFQHRPNQKIAAHPQDICRWMDYSYRLVSHDKEIDNSCELYLVAGAGILSPECVQGKKILNIHPGVVPAARGLDAFKWSIYQGRPSGITLHYIDKQVDLGEIVAIVPTPVFYSDTLESFARRHYENELRIISDFAHYLCHPINPFKGIAQQESTRRMPLELERELGRRFDEYKLKFAENQLYKG